MNSMNLMLRMSISLRHLDTLFIRLLACGTKGVGVFRAADIMDCWFSIEAKFMMASAQFPYFDSSLDNHYRSSSVQREMNKQSNSS
jgi:hypothetical protein